MATIETTIDFFIRTRKRKLPTSPKLRYPFTEARSDGDLYHLPLPAQPSAISAADVHTSVVEYNILGDRIIRRPIANHRPKKITLTGAILARDVKYATSLLQQGVDGTTYQARTATQVLSLFNEMIQQMRTGIDQYDLVDMLHGTIYQDVEVVDFGYEQSATGSRFGFTYTLTLMAFSGTKDTAPTERLSGYQAPRLAGPTPAAAAAAEAQIATQSLLQRMQELTQNIDDALSQVSVVTDALNTATTYVNVATNVALSPLATVRREIEKVNRAFSNLREALFSAIPDVLNAAYGVYNAAKSLLTNLIYNTAALFQETFTDRNSALRSTALAQGITQAIAVLQNAKPEIDASASALTAAFLVAEDAMFVAEQVFGGYDISAEARNTASLGTFLNARNNITALASRMGAPVLPSGEDPKNVETIPYTLRMGNSLYDVAAQVVGDITVWPQLAAANDWVSPYLDARGAVPAAGAQVNIPVALLVNTPGVNLQQTFNAPLLADLQLSNGDLLMTDDIQLISGEDNLVQAVVQRVSTTQGEQLAWANYGVYRAQDDFGATILAVDLAGQLLQDPRVLAISELSTQLNGDMLDVKLQITPVSAEAITLTVPVV